MLTTLLMIIWTVTIFCLGVTIGMHGDDYLYTSYGAS